MTLNKESLLENSFKQAENLVFLTKEGFSENEVAVLSIFHAVMGELGEVDLEKLNSETFQREHATELSFLIDLITDSEEFRSATSKIIKDIKNQQK